MPMIWNAEAHAKLLAALMQECDVKPNQKNYEALARVMGCTPKAVTHRISKFRNLALTEGGSTDGGEDKSKPAKTTAKLKASKAATTKKSKKPARTPSPEAAADVDDEEGVGPTPPPSARPKRESAKRDYAKLAAGEGEDEDDGEEGPEEDGLSKRVKIEVGEDIGEGLRQSTQFEEAMADGDDGGDAFT
ncbi:hypothetical protein B0A55_08612 [Friedmanniomyces simplex]|uniref:Uncharacterized protein n=1 Tax=Friedmanniomyces simplex TaxID=329884 RepID=A0A4U0X216_9PEZI|nr:hypothetical protein B0A55_08612 [Friedmanniomyces simplex]